MGDLIWKYKTDAETDHLAGVGPCPEPDFWSNKHPIWAICGPQRRAGRERNSRIFFVTQKDTAEHVPDYTVAGVMTVKEILDFQDLIMDPQISATWKVKYLHDLGHKDHLPRGLLNDHTQTTKQRIQNIIIGDSDESAWFGINGPTLPTLLNQTDIEIESELTTRQLADISADDGNRMFEYLTNTVEVIKGVPPTAVSDEDLSDEPSEETRCSC